MTKSEIDAFLYTRWRGMHKRCSANSPVFANYAGRGISVCSEWHEFEPFKEYAKLVIGVPDLSCGARWTLDRIDNDAGYCPGNIRWATYKENIRNRRSSVVVEYRGERVLAIELTERLGIPYFLFMDRVRRQKWSVERAVNTPVVAQYRRTSAASSGDLVFAFRGETKSLTEWAKEIRFDVQKVRRRLSRGWSFERAISAGYDRAASLKDTKHLISQHPTPSSARC